MDCKIITRLFFLIFCFIPTHLIAIEFTGKFLQGHFIIGQTDPTAKIIIDKNSCSVLFENLISSKFKISKALDGLDV